jgi:protein O-GlcNAc transferase
MDEHHSMSAADAFQLALRHHQQGRLSEAESIYRAILEVDPEHADSLHLLGVLAMQAGEFTVALDRIQHAIRLRPMAAAYYGNQGLVLEKLDRLAEAVQSLEKAIQLQPEYAEAYNNLGLLQRKQGEMVAAARNFERAIALQPGYAQAWSNWGLIAMDQQQFELAEQRFQHALSLAPELEVALHNLGMLTLRRGDWERAEGYHRQLLARNAANALGYHGLGSNWLQQGRFEEARQALEQALALDPALVEAWIHLGGVYHEQDRLPQAVACFRRAIAGEPASPEAWFNLGRSLSVLEEFSAAIEAFEQAVRLREDYAEAWSSLANQRQHLCRWDGLEAIQRRLIAMVEEEAPVAAGQLVNPSSFLVLGWPTTPALQSRCAKAWAKAKYPASAASLAGRPPRTARQRLRIAYLSGDFRQHVMAFHLAELFEQHDRESLEVFGYSIGPRDESPIRSRLIQGVDRFVDAWEDSTADLVARIRGDAIDILIDLQGYTLFSRPQVLASHPAPIQVSYLGFAGTTGSSWMDYILADEFIIPEAARAFFSEQVVYLPGCYQVNDGKMEIDPRRPTRAACGLPESGIVFSAFNNFFKVTPRLFDVWMQLLREVPESVLWLPDWHEESSNNLRMEAKRRRIDPLRLIFAPRLPLPQHVARQALADLFLDTFPFNAHGTASIALRSGVPIVTQAGSTMASRVAGSLLRQFCLEELITYDEANYFNLARQLALDGGRLAQIRQHLAKQLPGHPLWDGGCFARKLEAALRAMWDRHLSGLAPAGFRLTAEGTPILLGGAGA